MDERLNWPGWLTYSGWFTHMSGPINYMWSAGQGSSPARDRRYTAEPRNQPFFATPWFRVKLKSF